MYLVWHCTREYIVYDWETDRSRTIEDKSEAKGVVCVAEKEKVVTVT